MDTEDLRGWLAVAQSGHLTATAQQLGIPQPTLSRRVGRVERYLGTSLFERAGRQLTLNARGAAFVGYAQRALAELDAGAAEISRLMDPELGTIRLDFLHSLGTWMAPELIRTFRAEHPRVQFQLHQGSAFDLVERVLSDQSDVALVGPTPAEVGQTLGWTPLVRQPLALAVPAGHRLDQLGPIQLQEADGEPFVAMLPGFGTRQLLDELAADSDLTLDIVFESMELTTVAGLVSAGLGVGLVPLADPFLATVGVRTRPIDPPAYRDLGLMWRLEASPPPAVERFREFVARSRFRPDGGP